VQFGFAVYRVNDYDRLWCINRRVGAIRPSDFGD
jgi:hypothetical protein